MTRLLRKDRMAPPQGSFKMGMQVFHEDSFPGFGGEFIFDLKDLDGNQIVYWKKKNLITLDAGIQSARLFKDNLEPAHGANMLAVGSGATGSLLSPDAPDPRQRKLNAEIARKAFASTTFRDALGNAVAYPTHLVDYTTIYGEGEAVGALNEMSILSTISDNPAVTNPNPNSFPTYDTTVDVSGYDVAVNYLTFGVVSKASRSILTVTWRLTH